MQTFETRHPPSVAVVEAVATWRDVDITELPPLYDAIDPDALDNLVAHWDRGRTHPDRQIRFEYDGVTVLLDGDGQLAIETQ